MANKPEKKAVKPEINKPAPKKAATATAPQSKRTATPGKGKGRELSFVAASAMSADVGRKAVEAYAPIAVKQLEHQTEIKKLENTKGRTLAMLTEAFVKAAEKDDSIVLSDIYGDRNDDNVKLLRAKLEVAVGIKVVSKTS